MKLKQAILSAMDRDTLKAVVDDLEFEVVDRRIVEDMRTAMSRSHRATPEVLLEYLNEWQVKAVCEQMGIDPKGHPCLDAPVCPRFNLKGSESASPIRIRSQTQTYAHPFAPESRLFFYCRSYCSPCPLYHDRKLDLPKTILEKRLSCDRICRGHVL
jgi:hypothetical protein